MKFNFVYLEIHFMMSNYSFFLDLVVNYYGENCPVEMNKKWLTGYAKVGVIMRYRL